MARQVMLAGLEAGRNPRTVAIDIVGKTNKVTGKREGGFIGLTSAQAAHVERARQQLRDLDPAYFTRARRDKRFDPAIRKAIASGKPLSAADIDKITGRYKQRLLAYRGEVIARTESIDALRAGRHEGFQQLVDSGQVRQDQITVTWSATMDGRTRDSHVALNGQKQRFGNLFASPMTGALMEHPGDTTHGAPASETIQCRCVAQYRIRYID